MEVRRIGPDEVGVVLAAGHLFDAEPDPAWTQRFLELPGHHLLIAFLDGRAAGTITGVETTHPDKGTEMFLYELSVDEAHRRLGIGAALTAALADIARDRGCYGMWVSTEQDNVAAIATYRRAGGQPPEPFVTITWEFGEDRCD